MYTYTIHCSKLCSWTEQILTCIKWREEKELQSRNLTGSHICACISIWLTTFSQALNFSSLTRRAARYPEQGGCTARLLSTVSVECVQASVGAVIVCCLVPIISTKVHPGLERDHLVWPHSDIGISILVQLTRNSLACYSRSEPVDIYVCQERRACIVLRAICSYSYCTSSSVMRVRT